MIIFCFVLRTLVCIIILYKCYKGVFTEILVAPKLKKYRKIGLAFGGGGARGFALIGVIRALEEENIKFEGRY